MVWDAALWLTTLDKPWTLNGSNYSETYPTMYNNSLMDRAETNLTQNHEMMDRTRMGGLIFSSVQEQASFSEIFTC